MGRHERLDRCRIGAASACDTADDCRRISDNHSLKQHESLSAWYSASMAAEPVLTAEEWFERMRKAPPPTDDDVSILWDGTRLDSREKVMAWLEQVEAKRAADQAAGRADGSA